MTAQAIAGAQRFFQVDAGADLRQAGGAGQGFGGDVDGELVLRRVQREEKGKDLSMGAISDGSETT